MVLLRHFSTASYTGKTCQKKYSKECMKNFKWFWINLWNDYFEIVSVILLAMLNGNTSLTIEKTCGPDEPVGAWHLCQDRTIIGLCPPTRLFCKQRCASIASPTKIVHGTHSMPIGRTMAIFYGAKRLRFWHDIIISYREGGVK